MPWPEHIKLQFDLVNKFTTEESEYYGPINTLLVELFPATEHYQVSPQFKRRIGYVDFTVIYIVTRRRVPVMFVEVKPYIAYDSDSARAEADDQMRNRVRDFTSRSLPLDTLYGISTLGTRFCVYEYTPVNRALTPELILPDRVYVTDTAPKERWNLDFMEEAGEARLREVVNHVKNMAAALAD